MPGNKNTSQWGKYPSKSSSAEKEKPRKERAGRWSKSKSSSAKDQHHCPLDFHGNCRYDKHSEANNRRRCREHEEWCPEHPEQPRLIGQRCGECVTVCEAIEREAREIHRIRAELKKLRADMLEAEADFGANSGEFKKYVAREDRLKFDRERVKAKRNAQIHSMIQARHERPIVDDRAYFNVEDSEEEEAPDQVAENDEEEDGDEEEAEYDQDEQARSDEE